MSVLTLLVLMRAFQSVLLAVKAVVLKLASLAAAYGVLVFVWEDGHGSRALFGLPATGALPDWIPVVVFAFLSMSTAPFTFLKILATGLAAGVLIDAFVLRSLRVAALVALLGRWNWVVRNPMWRVLLMPVPTDG